MFDNKKSLAIEALVRIILVIAILLLVVFPAVDKIRAVFFNTDRKYLESFEEFVDRINEMRLGRGTFLLNLKEKSAIIGFSKNSNRYECFNCYVGIQNRPTVIVDKPNNQECNGKACICLCHGDFNLKKEILNKAETSFGQCGKYICKSSDKDIIDNTPVKEYPGINLIFTTIGGGTEHWKNGFLYTNGISGANGLKLNKNENLNLVVEKRSNLIGVCNKDILEINQKLGHSSCIITEYDEARKLEKDKPKKSIEKYEEYTKKYKSGREVEDSLFRLGKIHFELKKYQESADAYSRLLTEFPKTTYKEETIINLIELRKKPKVTIPKEILKMIEETQKRDKEITQAII